MDRYRKEVLQLSTRKHGINVQYLYDTDYAIIRGLMHQDLFELNNGLIEVPHSGSPLSGGPTSSIQ